MFGFDDAIGALLGIGKTVIERVWPDPNQQAQAQIELLRLQQAGAFKDLEADLQIALAQAKINEAEANNPNLFVAGWRPAIGWFCAFSIGYAYLLRPLGVFILVAIKPDAKIPPTLEMAEILGLTAGMLGLGFSRSWEKIKGVTK